jgi:hypothetical protein
MSRLDAVLCPNCKAAIHKVRPVHLPADPDSRRWTGPVPQALGFVCPQCAVLLPITPQWQAQTAVERA